MSFRSVRLGLVVALGGVLLASSAFAQRRGPLQVLGLRAPDGDDEAASAATTALRQAGRDLGFQVAADAPSLEQEVALFGCDLPVNADCLAQISGDVNSPRVVYGSVSRTGRGAQASLSIEVGLWDQAEHRIAGHQQTTIERARSRDSDAIRDMARRLLTPLVGPEPVATPVTTTTTTTTRTNVVTPPTPPVTPHPSGPSHVVRYVGYGVAGVGVVLGAIGVAQWVRSATQRSDSQSNAEWLSYDPDTRDAATVCDHATANSPPNPPASVRSFCDDNSSARTMALAFGISGVALTAAGIVMIAVDRSDPPREQNTNGTPGIASRLRVAPVLAPHVGGVNLGLTF